MVRQDIYGCISDDIVGQRGCSSSQRGLVKEIKTWINTDVAGSGTCTASFDKEKQNVKLDCNIPEKWEADIQKNENKNV